MIVVMHLKGQFVKDNSCAGSLSGSLVPNLLLELLSGNMNLRDVASIKLMLFSFISIP